MILAMVLSPRRKQILMRESRDLVFRVCSGGGALLGLVYALHHWDTKPTDCHGGSEALSRCASHTLGAGVLTFLLPVFAGAIAGAIVGALLASRIRSRRPPTAARKTAACRGRGPHGPRRPARQGGRPLAAGALPGAL
jgi:hypothetical protein